MDKSILRKYVLEKRNSLSDCETEKASQIIVNKLMNMSYIKESKVIMSYMSYGHEIDLKSLNKWILDEKKTLILPRVINGTEIDGVKVDNIYEDLVKGSFGILEPSLEKEPFDLNKINIVLVPGVIFDYEGNRIGHGKGYYDRFLSRCNKSTVFIGVAYTFQVLDSIPYNQYDIKVHEVITD